MGTDAMGTALLCPRTATGEVSSMLAFNTATNVTMAVGAAAVLAGGIWLIVDLATAHRTERTTAIAFDVSPIAAAGAGPALVVRMVVP